MSEKEKQELKSSMASICFWFVGERYDGSILFIRGCTGRGIRFANWEEVKGVCE